MKKIKLLPAHEARKIAAGEVIERPANVVKELVENALDAQAQSITVHIKEGGKKSIRVIDDGIGMDADDARLSICHHATSKIETVEDLESIKTFGFRGEALASIASVSTMTLSTQTHSSSSGITLLINDGVITSQTAIVQSPGTDITIENIFYNLPGRRKFLKKDDTEWRAIYQFMQACALSHPECSFTLVHNDRAIFNCQSSKSIEQRLPALYDIYLSKSMIECVATKNDAVSLSGFITNPTYARYDRSMIFLFVNKRWIKNPKLSHAVMKGYSGVLPHQRYPCAILFIDINPADIDVNIHPRKEEVQFLHPRKVEMALEAMVQKTLASHLHQLTGFAHTSHKTPSLEPTRELHSLAFSQSTRMPEKQILGPSINVEASSIVHRNTHKVIVPEQKNREIVPDNPTDFFDAAVQADNYKIIGQMHNTYIILETNEGMLIIDQHAAHERILFELFSHRFSDVSVIPLLFPLIISLQVDDCQTIMEYKDIFEKNGIAIDHCGTDQCAVRTLPVMLKNQNITEVIKDVLVCIHENGNIEQSLLQNKLHQKLKASMACKAAVKAGDELTTEHMQELINSLNKIENRFLCPHGRPTSWIVTWYEIERKFKRK